MVAAAESAGSAERENAKYLDSIEGKTKALESAMQELSTTSVSDELIKWFLDLEKGVVDFQTSIGGITPLILTLVTIFSSKLAPAIQVVGKLIGKTLVADFQALKGVVAGASIGFSGWLTIIAAAATVIFSVVGAVNNYNKAQKELRQQNIAMANATSDSSKTLNELYAKYQALYKVQNRTKEQEEELTTTSKSLEDAIGDRASVLKTLTNGTADYNTELTKVIQTQAGIDFAKVTSGINDFKKELDLSDYKIEIPQLSADNSVQDLVSNEAFDTLKDFINLKKELQNTTENYENIVPDAEILNIEDASKYLKSLITLQSGYNDQIVQANHDGNTLLATQISENEIYTKLNTIIPDLTAKLSEYNSLLVTQAVSEKEMAGEYPYTIQAYAAFREGIINNIGATGDWAATLRTMIDELFPQFKGKLDDLVDPDYVSRVSKMTEALSASESELSSLNSAYKTLSDAQDGYNKSGSLSIDTLSKLLALEPEYIKYLIDEKGNVNLNKEAYEDLVKEKVSALKTDLLNKYTAEMDDLTHSSKLQKDAVDKQVGSTYSYIQGEEEKRKINDVIKNQQTELTNEYNNTSSAVDNLTWSLDDEADVVERITEAYDEQSSTLDTAQSAYTTLKDAIEEYNKTGVLSVDMFQELLSLSPEYLQMFFDQSNATDLATAAINTQIQSLKDAKREEILASAAARILAISQSTVGTVASGAAGGVSSLGDASTNMGNKASSATPKVSGLAKEVANLYAALGGKVDIDWANDEIKKVMTDTTKLLSDLSNLSISSVGGSSSRGGGGGTSKAQQQAEDIKDAYDSLLGSTMSMLKQKTNDRIDQLQDELDIEEELYKAEKQRIEDAVDGYKEIIDAKKKSIQLDKDEKDYQDEISDKNKEIADIQNRLLELSFDNSESAKTEKLKLEEDLVEKRKDLSDTQCDRETELSEAAWDEDFDRYEASQEAQIATLDAAFEATKVDYEDRIELLKTYLEQENTIRSEAINLIAGKTATFYNELFSWNQKYGETSNAILQNVIDKAQETVSIVSGSSGSSKKSSSSKATTGLSYVTPTSTFASVDWKNLKAHHDGLDSGFIGGVKGNETFIKALKGEIGVTRGQQDNFTNKILPNMLKNAESGNNIKCDNLLSINVAGNLDPKSEANVIAAVNSQFKELNKVMAGNGLVRKANGFA